MMPQTEKKRDRRRPIAIALTTTLLVTIVSLCTGFATTPLVAQEYTVKKYQDIPYGPDPSVTQNWLDIYRPVELDQSPVILFVTGAGWNDSGGGGDKSQYSAFSNTMTGYYGVTVVVINIHLSPEVIHPGHIEDAALASVWVADNVRSYGGNPDEIFLLGHSSGAHLTALLNADESYLLALGSSRRIFMGVMSISGMYDLDKLLPIYNDMLTTAFGSTDPEVLAAASPATYVAPGMRPSALFYAEDDMPGLSIQSLGYGRRLGKSGNSVHLEQLPGVSHVSEIAEVNPDNPYHVTALAIWSYISGLTTQKSVPQMRSK